MKACSNIQIILDPDYFEVKYDKACESWVVKVPANLFFPCSVGTRVWSADEVIAKWVNPDRKIH